MDAKLPGRNDGANRSAPKRAMVQAELNGQHTYRTANGVQVRVWQRDGKYLARGRYQGAQFLHTLGSDTVAATHALHRLLVEIDDGRFVRRADARRLLVAKGPIPKLTLRDLIANFLDEKRKLRGRHTAEDYRARLMPVLEFAEKTTNSKRWPMAANVDRKFAVALRNHLFQEHTTTGNGCPGGRPKKASARQIFNILECFRNALSWARKPEVHQLPAEWSNPLTKDIVGERPRKNPLRESKLPVAERARLIGKMDEWELCHIAPLCVLPMRPEEASGLLIEDIDWEKSLLKFGTRLGGADFNKGHQEFVVPFPPELRPLFKRCVAGRPAGPLLRSKRAFQSKRCGAIESPGHLEDLLERALAKAAPETINTPQDRKKLFRQVLRQVGGASPDELAKAFNRIRSRLESAAAATIRDLRHEVTTDMHRAGVQHLELRYITGHTTKDILNEYVPMAPAEEMKKYEKSIRPLLEALTERARELGLLDDDAAKS